MTSYVAKVVSKRVLGESLQNKFGTEDPYFEQVPATRLGKPTGKLRRRKKALPPGISDNDGRILTKVKRRAYRLDLALCSFLGIRFGWSSVIALVPAIGDALDAFMALMVFKTCCQVDGGLPTSLKVQMLVNIVVDFAVGLIPFLGDLADAVFKANTRNALLLEQHLRAKGKTELRKSGLPLPAVDPSTPEEYDRQGHDDASAGQQPSSSHHHSVTTAQPPRPAKTQLQPSGDRSWFGHTKSRPNDLESGPSHGPR